ncbi:uncharacterized protein LOC142548030 [Primulina tabacum]|uniref:uncharacterized protein LOC142548030 n=1 Tax=Primulina tabacum TaxID=48773 RepID=UPI003F596789
MASSPAKKVSLLLLITLLSCTRTQARDNQLFSKVSAPAIPDQELPLNNNQQEEPNFIQRENENGYGLYGHESGQLPPSATGTSLLYTESEVPLHRHLPKNYNPEAYVTEQEGYTSDSNQQHSYTNNLKNYYRDAEKSYNNQQEDEETTSEPEQYRYNHNYQSYGGSSFNSEPQGLRDIRLPGRGPAQNSLRENYFYNGGADNGFQPQGMSDTRSLENGKYFYDINSEKYSNNHPYAVLNKAYNDYSERSYYGASENSMRESYQNQYEFQDEGNIP